MAHFKKRLVSAVVVAQLVERLLPIPEVRGSNPVIGKILFLYIEHLFTVNCVLKRRKIKKNRPGMAHFFLKKVCEWPVVDVIKLFFEGNLDFPKVKKLNKVCFNVTCTKM